MAQVVYTPELGGASGSATQTVPQNSASLADSIGQAFSGRFGQVIQDISDRLGQSYYDMHVGPANYSQIQAALSTGNEAALNNMLPSDPNEFLKEVNQNNSGTSAKSSGEFNLSGLLGSSAFQNNKSLQAMYEMFQKTGDTAWLEKMISSFGNIENMESARAYEKMMSDTSFSRLVADIEKSGFNPWLALQNGFGQASSYNSSAASIDGTSPSQQAISRANNENTVNANRLNTITSILSTVLRIGILVAMMA